MKAWMLALAVGLSLGSPLVASPAAQAGASIDEPALALVARLQTPRSLDDLANTAARRTVTFAMIVQAHGADAARRIVAEEIAKARPRYQARWDRQLASIYARHFTPDELRSLTQEGRRSPYAGKFAANNKAVGEDMRAASTGLLQQLVTEALKQALTR